MIFNIGFVIHPSRRVHSAEIAVYEPVVRKIARTVEMLEIETGFLSDENLKSKVGARELPCDSVCSDPFLAFFSSPLKRVVRG